jgi:hypothetical protein
MAEQFLFQIVVDDKGSPVIQRFTGTVQESTDKITKMGKALEYIKWDAITNLVHKAKNALRTIIDTTRELTSMADDIGRHANVIGISTRALQEWAYAAKMSDVESSTLSMGLRYLTDQMGQASRGTGEALKYFDAMGISIKNSEGRLRPLMDVVADIADRFATWTDGSEKLNYALNIFGQRAGSELVPLLNKGRVGIQEYANEAERLGLILDEKFIKRASEMEDTFKRWGEQWKAMKFRVLEVTTSIIDFLTKQREIMGMKFSFTGGFQPAGPPQLPSIEGWFGSQTLPGAITPPPLPAGTKPGKEIKDWIAEIQMAVNSFQWTRENWVEPPTAITVTLKELDDAAERAKKSEEDLFDLTKAIYSSPEMSAWEPGTISLKDYEAGLERAKKAEDSLFEVTKAVHAVVSDAEFMEPGTISLKEYEQQIKKTEEETKKWGQYAEGIADIWSSSFSTMRRSGEDFGDWFRNLWLDMTDYAIGQIWKIAANYALMGDMVGKYETGKGLLGLLGKLFTSIGPGASPGGAAAGGAAGGLVGGAAMMAAQSGFEGWVNRPTWFFTGEKAREHVSITPEGKVQSGEGQGNQGMNFNINIFSPDAKSFKDMCDRNPQAVISPILTALHMGDRSLFAAIRRVR